MAGSSIVGPVDRATASSSPAFIKWREYRDHYLATHRPTKAVVPRVVRGAPEVELCRHIREYDIPASIDELLATTPIVRAIGSFGEATISSFLFSSFRTATQETRQANVNSTKAFDKQNLPEYERLRGVEKALGHRIREQTIREAMEKASNEWKPSDGWDRERAIANARRVAGDGDGIFESRLTDDNNKSFRFAFNNGLAITGPIGLWFEDQQTYHSHHRISHVIAYLLRPQQPLNGTYELILLESYDTVQIAPPGDWEDIILEGFKTFFGPRIVLRTPVRGQKLNLTGEDGGEGQCVLWAIKMIELLALVDPYTVTEAELVARIGGITRHGGRRSPRTRRQRRPTHRKSRTN
jgi:hypothetical protein